MPACVTGSEVDSSVVGLVTLPSVRVSHNVIMERPDNYRNIIRPNYVAQARLVKHILVILEYRDYILHINYK